MYRFITDAITITVKCQYVSGVLFAKSLRRILTILKWTFITKHALAPSLITKRPRITALELGTAMVSLNGQCAK
jgi:uncharacterized integral membrane protein